MCRGVWCIYHHHDAAALAFNTVHYNKYRSLGKWCSHVSMSYKSIKEGRIPPSYKLSKADMNIFSNEMIYNFKILQLK